MKVIICDDNAKEREHYSAILKQLAVKHGIALELSTYDSAKSLLFEAQGSKFSVDLIYMDVNMPNITGDEASRKLRAEGYMNDIVFLTVSKEHYDNAFDVDALHYVAKGRTTAEDFEKIFLKAVEAHNERQEDFAVYYGGGETKNIPLKSIRYYSINRKIVTVHYDQDNCFSFPQMSLEELENELSEYGFFRIHRSYMVALRGIESVTYTEVALRDGTKLPVSRSKYAELKELFMSKVKGTGGRGVENQ